MNKICLPYSDVSIFLRHAAIASFKDEPLRLTWRIIYDYELIFVIEGSVTVEYKNKKIVLKQYDVHIMEPGIWHRRYTNPGVKVKYYNFHFEFTDKTSERHINLDAKSVYIDNLKVVGDKSVVIKSLIDRDIIFLKDYVVPTQMLALKPQLLLICCSQIINDYYEASDLNKRNATLMFRFLVGEILAESVKTKNGFSVKAVIQDFIDFVNQHITENIDVIKFSIDQGFSYDYFRKLFKEHMEIPPHQYVQKQKISIAMSYLKSGLYNVDGTARALGYSSPYYFSAQFKKITGVYPKKFMPSLERNNYEKTKM